jgi:hypothetical protein
MKKRTLAVCLLFPLLGSIASARTMKLPDGESPVASVEIPDSWTNQKVDKGISCKSSDGNERIFFEVTAAGNLDELIDENVKFLEKQKVKVDEASKQSGKLPAGSLSGTYTQWEGKDEFGSETIKMYFVNIAKGKIMMITYWATKTGEEKSKGQLDAIFESVKPIEG